MFFSLGLTAIILIPSVANKFIDYIKEDIIQQTEKIASIVETELKNGRLTAAEAINNIQLGPNYHMSIYDEKLKIVASCPDTFENILEKLESDEVELLKKGEKIFGFSRNKIPDKRFHYCLVPFQASSGIKGGLLATVSISKNEKRKYEFETKIWITLLIALLASSAVGFLLFKWLVTPLNSIHDATIAFSNGDFSKRITINSNDEIGKTAAVLNKMAERIGDLIKTQQELFTDVSHEFKTPLTTIRGCAEAILDGIVTDENELKAYHQTILNETKTLSLLVNDIIELSKLESKTYQAEIDAVNAAPVIVKVIDKFKIMLESKKIKLTKNFNENDKIIISSEDGMLNRLFKNIIENAINNAHDNGEIKIHFQDGEKSINFKISNTGEEITEEFRDKVFQRFFRIDGSRSRTSGGTGLGLSICQKIIEVTGGEIKFIEPEKGYATTLDVTLKK